MFNQKAKITKKKVMDNFHCVCIPYCHAHNLLKREDAAFYTSGVYGWNCDVYLMHFDCKAYAITTGYRAFGKQLDIDIIDSLDKECEEVYARNRWIDWKDFSLSDKKKILYARKHFLEYVKTVVFG